MSGNVFFVGLDYELVGKIANEYANLTNKFFLDTKKLIEYTLIEPERVIRVCGIEYFEKERKKILKSLTNYEKTIINLPNEYLIDEDLEKFFKDSTVIFIDFNDDILNKLNLTKGKDNNLYVDLIVSNELRELLASKATYVVKDSSGNIEKIMENINNLNIGDNQ